MPATGARKEWLPAVVKTASTSVNATPLTGVVPLTSTSLKSTAMSAGTPVTVTIVMPAFVAVRTRVELLMLTPTVGELNVKPVRSVPVVQDVDVLSTLTPVIR